MVHDLTGYLYKENLLGELVRDFARDKDFFEVR